MKKKKGRLFMIVTSVLLLLVLQTLPAFILKPWGSKTLKSYFINLYYQPSDEKGAREVFDLLSEKSDEIYEKMKFPREEPIDVYIYKTQNQLAIREAGFITLTFAPSWHIGDSHWGNIMMVSPNTPVKGHTHDSILTATLHELVHAINYRINKKLSYFWDNGLATYLAGQIPDDYDYKSRTIPSISDMDTNNGLKFASMGGYAFSYKYIEFLDNIYGWDKVIAYAAGQGSYEEVFGKSESQIYDEWCIYLRSQ
ncbi:hypothetical protein [Alkaliphilus serpentinus]|uniref:Peptidase MA superfamily protein n=1 Tax=Alkaliphilus serpentinus TaxID=1482731 RepID=A0A833HL91_9FIRM|nr:hypothetical protein [Alkaliphilus serpentinus]KAB3525513.1 hypothetical protein F8153_15175 [Alkaliphilus serpentinus]